ncbi:unnamed protein product [Vitrella brassicaformis CCMP3155]|uniref:Uncharacterized protein n=1 Tax=Vitrella brassicaformis (strain CCMP3155) TaxID=1169540 RepID=A0A0G4FI48_VITBC|nr:unnamed protein product [Vitrella brassicaformis CCMP3155]|eukprot:CEM13132.1 unnamed protein product [Vitrella brassicaformis CCMP3155]
MSQGSLPMKTGVDEAEHKAPHPIYCQQVPYDWRFPVVSQRVKAVKLLRTRITSHYLPPKMVARRITALAPAGPLGVGPRKWPLTVVMQSSSAAAR